MPSNGLAFSCRERAETNCQNANDLAREAVSCNAGLGVSLDRIQRSNRLSELLLSIVLPSDLGTQHGSREDQHRVHAQYACGMLTDHAQVPRARLVAAHRHWRSRLLWQLDMPRDMPPIFGQAMRHIGCWRVRYPPIPSQSQTSLYVGEHAHQGG